MYAGDRRLVHGVERSDEEIADLMHDAKTGLVAHLEAFAGNTIEFIRSESPLLIDGIGIPDIDVDVYRRHVVVVADGPGAEDDLKALKPFIKEYQPVLVGVGAGADTCEKCGYQPQLIVGNPDQMSAEVLKCGAQVVLPADADGHASGLERIQDLGIGAMTFPAAGSAADLALLLVDHHGASLIVTVGHPASIEEFFDRSRQQSNPSTFLTRLKVGEKLVDAKAVATLYRNHISGGAIAMLVLAVLFAIVAALWVSRGDTVVVDWFVDLLEPLLAVDSGLGQLERGTVISLRHHAISLAAVFLALALGVVLGSGVLSDTLLSGLRSEKQDLNDTDHRADRPAQCAERKARCRRPIRHPDVGPHRSGRAGGQVGGAVPHARRRQRRRRRDAPDHRPVRGHRDRNRGTDPGVRRRQLGGETALGGQLADPPGRGAAEHHAGRPGLAGR